MTIVAATLALLTLGAASRSLADDKDKLVGTWNLISAVSEDLATGQKTNIYKGKPVGLIAYGADGRGRRSFARWSLMRVLTQLRAAE
jgi:hypothetical protein